MSVRIISQTLICVLQLITVKWIPAWFPGAGFQAWAEDAKLRFIEIARAPFYKAKSNVVSDDSITGRSISVKKELSPSYLDKETCASCNRLWRAFRKSMTQRMKMLSCSQQVVFWAVNNFTYWTISADLRCYGWSAGTETASTIILARRRCNLMHHYLLTVDV